MLPARDGNLNLQIGFFRTLFFAFFLVFALTSGMALLSPHTPASPLGIGLFAFCVSLSLLIGPLWRPVATKIPEWLQRYPIISGAIGSLVFATVGAYLTWAGLNYSAVENPETKKIFGLIYRTFGYQGIGFVLLCGGIGAIIASLFMLINIFRKKA